VAIAKTKRQLEDDSCKDASTAGRNLAVQKGIALDHSLKMRGEPTVIHEHRQAEDIVRNLKRLAPRVFDAEGKADEVKPAQLPSAAAAAAAVSNGHLPDPEGKTSVETEQSYDATYDVDEGYDDGSYEQPYDPSEADWEEAEVEGPYQTPAEA